MINIKRSKLKQDLLILFLSNKNKEFYMRQIERETGHFVGNIQKELKVLERDGLFTKRRESNRVYYKINKKYHYWDEIKRDLIIHSSPKQILNSIPDLPENCMEVYKRDDPMVIPPYNLILVGDSEREAVEKHIRFLEQWTSHPWKYSFLKPDDDEYLMITIDPKTSLVWKKD